MGSGGRSVGMVRSRTKAKEFSFILVYTQFYPLDGVIPLSLPFGQTLEVLEALEMKEMFLEHYA